MMFCPACGAETMDNTKFCPKCGKSLKYEPTNAEIYEMLAENRAARGRKKDAIVLVLIILAASVIAIYAEENANTAYIRVNVHSTHVTETVDIQMIIDGKVLMTCEDVEPGYIHWNKNYFKVHFRLLDDSKLITIKAVSTGGLLGTQEDSIDLIVSDGEHYTVDLYV